MLEPQEAAQELLIVQVCDFADDGDAHYRQHEPSRQLARLSGVTAVDCHFCHRWLPWLWEHADILVLQFVNDWDLFPLIEARRRRGQATVFEANDYFFDLQPWNPISQHWLDRATQAAYRAFMAAADAVQTSSQELARHWRPLARRVAVFPNHLAEVPPLPPRPPRPLTIGWGGSPGHFADWYYVAPMLQRWLEGHPQVHLAVMCHEYARPFLELPPERYHFVPFGNIDQYRRFLTTLDIGLAPLLPTEYNRCRSDVKYLEYASHGVAGIYSNLEPYCQTIVHGETGLLYQTLDELRFALDRLTADKSLLQHIRRRAYEEVSSRRRIATNIEDRLRFYRGLLLPDRKNQTRLPEDLVRLAETEGRYLRLLPGEPERTLVQGMAGPASQDLAARLGQVTAAFPDFARARHQLGKILNDLGDPAQARRQLEMARLHAPLSAAVIAELGRSCFLAKDPSAAGDYLHQALRLNPWYYPGWQYLLRLYRYSPAADAATWAAAARRQFPTVFLLALAGVPLHPPDQAVALLRQLLDEFAPTLKPEEGNLAALAFGQTLTEVARTVRAMGPFLDLLRRGCEVFPGSARMATLLGQALRQAGEEVESLEALARGLSLERQAALWEQEKLTGDGVRHLWQFADHIRRCVGPAS